MTLQDFIDDLKILTKQLSDDSHLSPSHLAQKVHEYRAIFIQNFFYEHGEINYLWVQNTGKFNLTKVNSSDMEVQASTLCFGKVTLPGVVWLDGDNGVFRISNSSNQKRIYPIELSALMNLIEANECGLFKYYYRRENEYFIYPYISEINASLIAENPMDIKVFTTETITSGNIIFGESYTVTIGNIFYNAVTYNAGSTFIGTTTTTFTGNGTVKYTNNSRSRLYTDNYPCDLAMAEKIILEILTKDLQIEKQQISDIVNDASDQLKVLANYAMQAKANR
jgi:hypothetical protein